MKRKAFLNTMVVVSCLLWVMGGLGAEAAQFKAEKPEIKVAVSLSSSTFLPIYLALDQGFYKEEGLSVELVTFRGGSALLKGVVGGSVDIGVSGLASLSLGIKAGQDLKVFYAGINPSGFYWYSVDRIKSLADAKGATFGVSRYGSTTDFLTRYVLKARGLDPQQDVKIVQGGGSASRAAAMEKGQIDVNIYAAPDNFMAAEKGYRQLLALSEVVPEYPMQSLYATGDFIRKNPNTIKAFLRAHVKAVRLAKKDKALSVRTLVKHVRLEEKYAALGYDDFINNLYEDGRWPDEKSMNAFWEIGIMAGTYKEKWPVEKYFDSTFTDSYSEWKP